MKKRILTGLLAGLMLLPGCGNQERPNGASGGLLIENHGLTEDVSGDALPDAAFFAVYAADLEQSVESLPTAQQPEFLLDYANDMITCQVQGLVNPETLAAAQAITELFPHPLLLNNYATMLLSGGDASGAALVLERALTDQPDDATMLTNLANAYLARGDLAGAMDAAAKALRREPDYGLAYQVMTTVHLANGDSVLAAETMLKEGKNCWNEITTHHFRSFNLAVYELDEETDEHPFNDTALRLLYQLAREGVDLTETDSQMDTPGSAQRFPFPFPTDGNSYRYAELGELGAGTIHDECYGEYDKLQKEGMKYDLSYEDSLYPSRRSPEPAVIRDLRQFWVLELL